MPPWTWTWTRAWPPSWTHRSASSQARTCWRERTPSSDSAIPSTGADEVAEGVEDLGCDSLFITDHLLAAKRFYSVSWLEPVSALAVVAGVTERVRLGTSILIMPLRNPGMLAKELATL